MSWIMIDHVEPPLAEDCPSLADATAIVRFEAPNAAVRRYAIKARDAMPDGGRLSFRARCTDEFPDGADAAAIPSALAGSHVALGAALVFAPGRDLLELVSGMMELLVSESCGN